MSKIMNREQIFLRLNIDKFGLSEKSDKGKLDFETWLEKKRSEEKLKRLKEEEVLDLERQQCLENIKRKTLAEQKYEEWCAQKEQEIHIKMLQREQEENELQIYEIRKILSRIKFDEWLAKKRRQSDKKQNHKEKESLQEEQEQRKILAQQKFQEWLRRKEKEKSVQKVNELFEQIREQKANKIRKKECELAYNIWLVKAKSKSKQHTPSRKSSLTHRPTASIGFINPNPWQPNIEKG